MRRRLTIIGVALPGLALAGLGLLHPPYLDVSTARAWWTLHLVLLPVFPLLGVSLWVLLRGESGPLAWAARIAGYAYATLYTGLDVLAGVAGGLMVEAQQGGSPAVGRLFTVGGWLGASGVAALAVAALLTGAVLIRRHGSRALPGTVLLAGSCVPFLPGHIYHPTGVLAMLGIAAGCALLAAAERAAEPTAHPEPAAPITGS